MEPRPLTKKQAKVLEYVINHIEKGNGSPTVREVGSAFGMNSTGSVRDVFRALTKKGYMIHAEGKSRGNRLNPQLFSIQVKGKNRIKLKPKKR